MKKTLVTFITLVFLSTPFAVSANGMNIMSFDVDQSGTISEKEFYDGRNANIAEKAKQGRQMRGLANIKSFGDLDTNSDGQLTHDEIANIQMNHGIRGKVPPSK